MPLIKIETIGTAGIMQTLKSANNELEEAIASINSLKSELDMKVAVKEDLLGRINKIQYKMQEQADQINIFYKILSDAKQQYENCDKKTAKSINDLSYNMAKMMVSFNLAMLNSAMQNAVNSFFNKKYKISSASEEDLSYALMLIRKVYLDKYIGNTQDVGVQIYNYLNGLEEYGFMKAFGSYSHIAQFMEDVKGSDVYLFFVSNWLDGVGATIESLITGENIADTFLDNKDACKTILRNIINDLNNMEDANYLNGDLKQMQDIANSVAEKAGFDDVELYNNALNSVMKGIEGGEKAVADYTENIAMLESIKDMLPPNDTLSEVIDDLINDYENQFVAELKDIGIEAGMDVAKVIAENTVLKPVLKTEAIMQTLVDAMAGKEIDSIETALYTSELIYGGASKAFNDCAQIIMSGDFTEQDVNNYINAFNLNKSLKLEQYNAMMDYYDNGSSEAKFLEQQIEQLESSTYQNFNLGESYGSGNRGF